MRKTRFTHDDVFTPPSSKKTTFVIVVVLAAGIVAAAGVGFLAGRSSEKQDRQANPAPVAVQPAEAKKEQPAVVVPPKPEGREKLVVAQSVAKGKFHGLLRSELIRQLGDPDDVDTDAPWAGWDGPALIFKGEFKPDNGGKSAYAMRVYFKHGVVAFIDFFTKVD